MSVRRARLATLGAVAVAGLLLVAVGVGAGEVFQPSSTTVPASDSGVVAPSSEQPYQALIAPEDNALEKLREDWAAGRERPAMDTVQSISDSTGLSTADVLESGYAHVALEPPLPISVLPRFETVLPLDEATAAVYAELDTGYPIILYGDLDTDFRIQLVDALGQLAERVRSDGSGRIVGADSVDDALQSIDLAREGPLVVLSLSTPLESFLPIDVMVRDDPHTFGVLISLIPRQSPPKTFDGAFTNDLVAGFERAYEK